VLLSGLTALGQTVLLIVALTFILWAIVTAIFIPKRDQRFPRDLNLYITITVVLFAAQMGTVWWVTGTQEAEHAEAAVHEPTTSETTAETTTAETEATATTETTATESETTAPESETTETAETQTETTETAETETTAATETETGEATPGGDAAAGKEVFASAGCGSCHTLADAGSSGAVGPNLDDAQPSAELVVDLVTNGRGAMPPFKDQLSEQQIADVAAYVSSVAGT